MGREGSAVSLWVKYALFFENFLLWLLGLIFTGLGAYILVQKGKVVTDAIDFFFDPSTVMCTAGSAIIFITFFGWMGALREYTSFLRAYNWMLSLIFLGEIVLVILVFVFYFVPDAKQQLGLFPEQTFKDAIRKYGIVEDDDMRNFIDSMQTTLGCCGFSDSETGFLDWNGNQYYNCTKPAHTPASAESCSVPASCCKLSPGQMKNILCGRKVMKIDSAGKVQESDSHNPIYKIGCLKAVGEFINDHAMVIGGVLLGILLPQIFFMYLARNLRDQVLTQRAKWQRIRP